MVSRAEAERYARAEDRLDRELRGDILRVWRSIEGRSPEYMRDALLEVLPTLVDKYGEGSAVLAAEYFESLVPSSGAVLAPLTSGEAVRASTRAAAGALWTSAPSQTLNMVTASAVRHMRQAGRSTIHESTRRADGYAYGRVPDPGACSWCLMLASRGAVYATKRTAGGDGNDYHDECRCDPTPVPIGDAGALPYDVDALYEQYMKARESSGGITDKEIAAEMRRMYGLK